MLTLANPIHVIEYGSGFQGTVKNLGKGIALLLKYSVNCIFVLTGSPKPKDAQTRPKILVYAEQLTIYKSGFGFVHLARGC